ncbi:MAG: hypothetical protein HY897_25240 [Deltaproteobacteria bacterium]|nr:hypothetical protein [Deltaproteobacteria bacterium]
MFGIWSPHGTSVLHFPRFSLGTKEIQKEDPIRTPALPYGSEFAYSTNPAENTLTILLEAELAESADPQDTQYLRWRLFDDGGIGEVRIFPGEPVTGTWSQQELIGTEKYGKGSPVTATFTGLPINNSSFGKKKAVLYEYKGSGTPTKLDDAFFEVFFYKDGKNHPGDPANSPNWFYYWIPVMSFGKIENRIYSDVINVWLSTYAETDPPTRTTTFSMEASRPNVNTGNSGIYAFNEIITHENCHIDLWEQWWCKGCINTLGDDPEQDGYPNWWEDGAEGRAAGFSSTRNDKYSGERWVQGQKQHTAGYKYEEGVCRAKERSPLAPNWTLDIFDWSMSTLSSDQGKQWGR